MTGALDDRYPRNQGLSMSQQFKARSSSTRGTAYGDANFDGAESCQVFCESKTIRYLCFMFLRLPVFDSLPPGSCTTSMNLADIPVVIILQSSESAFICLCC